MDPREDWTLDRSAIRDKELPPVSVELPGRSFDALQTGPGEKEPLKIPHVRFRLKIRILRFFPPITEARPEIWDPCFPPCPPPAWSCTPAPKARKACGEAKNALGSEDAEAVGKKSHLDTIQPWRCHHTCRS